VGVHVAKLGYFLYKQISSISISISLSVSSALLRLFIHQNYLKAMAVHLSSKHSAIWPFQTSHLEVPFAIHDLLEYIDLYNVMISKTAFICDCQLSFIHNHQSWQMVKQWNWRHKRTTGNCIPISGKSKSSVRQNPMEFELLINTSSVPNWLSF
jgi:hypothetical protein